MQYDVSTVEEYIAAIPENRRSIIVKLRNIILSNLSEGYAEEISSGMINYVIPLSRYPKGYHVKKNEPLPFIALASQKHYIALYHMGLYSNKDLKEWFINEYANHVKTKLDMGKVCIRFKNLDHVPYNLIAQLCQKMTVDEYIDLYDRMMFSK
jgi:hypothetical protein